MSLNHCHRVRKSLWTKQCISKRKTASPQALLATATNNTGTEAQFIRDQSWFSKHFKLQRYTKSVVLILEYCAARFGGWLCDFQRRFGNKFETWWLFAIIYVIHHQKGKALKLAKGNIVRCFKLNMIVFGCHKFKVLNVFCYKHHKHIVKFITLITETFEKHNIIIALEHFYVINKTTF